MKNIFDISVPLSPGLPVWPGDQKVEINQLFKIEKKGDSNLTSIKLSSHTGTHIDAPLHFVKDGKSTLEIPLELLIGNCLVVDARGLQKITPDDLNNMDIPESTTKILFKTDNSVLWENPKHIFKKDFCALTVEAARWIVDRNIHLVGIDYASIQLFTDPADTHVVLLSDEIVIVENLDLRFVQPGIYRLICLPLKIEGVEGTVARAILESV
ncbi:MAG: cyclase family protein [Bacteroidota bacterium]